MFWPRDGVSAWTRSDQFIGNFNATRESCDRYLRIEFYADVPILGRESAHVLMTYADECSCYKMWIFSSMREEPTVLYGEFRDDVLTFVESHQRRFGACSECDAASGRVADGVVDYCFRILDDRRVCALLPRPVLTPAHESNWERVEFADAVPDLDIDLPCLFGNGV